MRCQEKICLPFTLNQGIQGSDIIIIIKMWVERMNDPYSISNVKYTKSESISKPTAADAIQISGSDGAFTPLSHPLHRMFSSNDCHQN
jgi:hypothetical protein